MKYVQRTDGEWIKPKGRFHKVACCDCNLVHLFEFRRTGRRVMFRAWRDHRATAARRRKS